MSKQKDLYTMMREYWNIHEEYGFDHYCAALYFRLVDRFNFFKWPDTLGISDDSLCSILCISPTALRNARKKLLEHRVIYMRAGGHGYKDRNTYSLSSRFVATNSPPNEMANRTTTNEGNCPPIIYKNKTKTEEIENVIGEEQFSIDVILDEIRRVNQSWITNILQQYHIGEDEFERIWTEFVLHCHSMAKTNRTIAETTNHFSNWIRIKKNKKSENNGINTFKSISRAQQREVEISNSRRETTERLASIDAAYTSAVGGTSPS